MSDVFKVQVTVNGKSYEREVPSRLLLSDFLRHELKLTGTHVGCEHGVCGACTVLLDDEAVRSCIMLTPQVHQMTIATVEGLAENPKNLHPLQEAFREAHGLQCGFCTPGILMTLNEQRTTNNEQRTTNNEQRTTNNEQRTTNNEQR